jgi:hypothetical protein
MSDDQALSIADRFTIFEQMNLHQQSIDAGWGHEQAEAYVNLYWPEGKFNVIDLRHTTFAGPEELKRMYDYAHSVFPIAKWSHSMGPFRIEGGGEHATTHWRWVVQWRSEIQGVVSTDVYDDKWEKREGVWKCIERTSTVDQNWPAQTFQPYVDRQDELFRAS